MKPTLTLVAALLLVRLVALHAAEISTPATTPETAISRHAGSAGVLLAFNGSSDFGPQTPGTRTDGWQEAWHFCEREARDLTVKGGFGNRMQFTSGVDQGAKGVTGIVLGGRRNVIELGKRGNHERLPKGRTLILAESAEGNQINLMDSELEDPHDIVPDQARTPKGNTLL